MKKITVILLLCASLSSLTQVSAQVEYRVSIDSLKNEIKLLQRENRKLSNKIKDINLKFEDLRSKLDGLQVQITENTNFISRTNNELEQRMSTDEKVTDQKIVNIHKSLINKSLIGLLGGISIFVISGLLYWFLSKRQRTDKLNIIDQLSKTKSSIEESLMKEFVKHTDLMEVQVRQLKDQKSTTAVQSTNEPDHSLALKVADEITLIERNLSLMDPKVKGYKQLQASIGKLKDNLNANGYQMPDLLGKQFHQGMKVIVVSSIPDEGLDKGVEVVTKIIKPQVNFNEKMIQAAQIEVSVGY